MSTEYTFYEEKEPWKIFSIYENSSKLCMIAGDKNNYITSTYEEPEELLKRLIYACQACLYNMPHTTKEEFVERYVKPMSW